MLAKLRTYSMLGIEAMPVELEVDFSAAALPEDGVGRIARRYCQRIDLEHSYSYSYSYSTKQAMTDVIFDAAKLV